MNRRSFFLRAVTVAASLLGFGGAAAATTKNPVYAIGPYFEPGAKVRVIGGPNKWCISWTGTVARSTEPEQMARGLAGVALGRFDILGDNNWFALRSEFLERVGS